MGEAYVFDISAKAENDLSAKQYYAVELSAADQVDVCDNVADIPVGILQNKPLAGEAAQVRVQGITRAVSDGTVAIAVNDWVGTDAAGKVVKKAVDKNFAIGRAMDASAADGVIIRVLLQPTYLGV